MAELNQGSLDYIGKGERDLKFTMEELKKIWTFVIEKLDENNLSQHQIKDYNNTLRSIHFLASMREEKDKKNT